MTENGFFVNTVGQIFPNPVTSSSNINVTLNNATDLKVNIVNQLGQKISSTVYKLTEGSHRLQLDVANLPAGIYFVKIVPQDHINIVRKFVKTK